MNQDRRQVRVRYRRGRGREGISPVPSLRQGSGPPLRAATGTAPRPLRRTPAPDSSPGPAPRPPAASAHEAGAPRLSLPIDRVRVHYDVVVVGSGYGGAIAASRFARAGRSVCVLERGREIRTGQFPDTAWGALRELQLRSRGRRRLGSPSGLFDLHTGYDLSVLVGCGLGGTSLINAGVTLRPPAWVFDDERWPATLRGRGATELEPYFRRAERMLGSKPYPVDAPHLPKHAALGRAAGALGAEVGRPPVAIAFSDGPSAAGVDQAACVLCGDCVSGCNHGAKSTLATNYLPDAAAHGAELFCEAQVRTLRPAAGGGWIVTYDVLADGRPGFDAPASFVHADTVVLAAGTLGSSGILLRSRAEGLAVSPRLGERFSGNGDVLAFAYDAEVPVRGIGAGRSPVTPETAVGPCISGMIDLTGRSDTGQGLLVQEGAIPGALRPVLPVALAAGAELPGGGGPLSYARRLARRILSSPRVLRRRGGAADDTLTYLVMSDDAGDGRLVLEGDAPRVDWTGVGDLPVFDHHDAVLDQATDALGATLVGNPLSTPLFHDSLVTVHPLGGCAMGDDGTQGVVDHRGRVFAGEGSEVHEGLLVVDGAIVPRPLTVNPLLTISALAERACALLAAERGWRVHDEPTPPLGTPPAPRPGIRFTERMTGWVAPVADGDPNVGATRGKADGTSIEFVLTVVVDDLAALVDDPATPGRLAGTVVAPLLSTRRLQVADGTFHLMVEDRTRVETWLMRYSMTLVAEDGRRFRFEGTKTLHDRAGFDAWSDTTTLHVTIHELPPAPEGVWSANGERPDDAAGSSSGATPDGVVVAGVMRLSPGDFARQLTTMRVTGVDSAAERAVWLGRFCSRFCRGLLRVYGGPLDDVGRFPAAPPTPIPLAGDGRRRLRVPAPEPRWCDASGRWHEGDEVGDDAWLRLTRYEGGRRGPVLLAPGFGMSATSFLGGTIHTNLTEHLVAGGYDVWLFDYRASIDLPSARTEFSIDEIATEDWPAAVAEVQRVTGASTVQALGHCVGSVSLMMALAAGLADVRSAVCMQFTLHPVTSYLNLVKATLGIGHRLRALGVRHVAPFTGRTLPNVLADLALRLVPMPTDERCGKAVCRWVNAIYGCTHRHDQLDQETHEELDQMFHVGNVEALNHLARMMTARAAVDRDGREAYLAHPTRLALPMLLVQGELNYIFRPRGSLRTLRWLQAANDPSLYERVVLPGYAHLDALIGRDAPRDVFPLISAHLDRYNR